MKQLKKQSRPITNEMWVIEWFDSDTLGNAFYAPEHDGVIKPKRVYTQEELRELRHNMCDIISNVFDKELPHDGKDEQDNEVNYDLKYRMYGSIMTQIDDMITKKLTQPWELIAIENAARAYKLEVAQWQKNTVDGFVSAPVDPKVFCKSHLMQQKFLKECLDLINRDRKKLHKDLDKIKTDYTKSKIKKDRTSV